MNMSTYLVFITFVLVFCIAIIANKNLQDEADSLRIELHNCKHHQGG